MRPTAIGAQALQSQSLASASASSPLAQVGFRLPTTTELAQWPAALLEDKTSRQIATHLAIATHAVPLSSHAVQSLAGSWKQRSAPQRALEEIWGDFDPLK